MHSDDMTAQQQAAKIIEQWIAGTRPEAKKVLAEHPEWQLDKAIVLDLAYAEYYLRQRAGENLELEEFCNQFPDVRVSLARLVAQQSLREAERPPVDLPGTTPAPPTDVVAPDVVAHTQNVEIVPVHEVSAKDTSNSPKPKTMPLSSGASGSRLGPTEWPTSGSKVGDYDLKRQMGRGAFGRVFLAFEETTERFVVVKLSKSRCDEAKVLGKLVHKNVVSVLSAPQDQMTGLYIIAMPYHGSATLEDLIELAYPLAPTDTTPKRAELILTAARRNHHLTDPRPDEFRPDQFLNRASFIDGVVWLGVRLAEALHAVHDSGFVHHDLKPSNVLLGMDGQPRLLDFNLATDVKSTKSRLGGTLPYMPPEHLHAIEKANLDNPTTATMNAQGDIFSFGVIMYELLTGNHPYGRFPKQRSVRLVASEMLGRQKLGIKPIRSRNPEVPTRLAKLIERCLAFEPSQRPTTAADVATDLRQCYSLKKRAYAFATSSTGRSLFTLAAITGASTMAYTLTPKSHGYSITIDHRAEADKALAAKRYRDAIPPLTALTNANQADFDAWRQLGFVKIALRELHPTHELRKAVDLRPADGPTLALLGWAETRQGNYNEGQEMLNRAIRNGYDNAGVRNTLAFCYAQRRQDEIAKTELAAALRHDPNYAPALVNRAYLNCVRATNEKRIPEALLEEVDATVKAAKPDPNLYLWAARIHALAALKAGNPKGPATPQVAKYKARSLELLRWAAEVGASDSLWTNDTLFTAVHGNANVYAKEWVRKIQPADGQSDWRVGNPLTDLPQ